MTNQPPSLRARLIALWPLKFFGLTGGMTAFFYAYFWLLQHPARPPQVMPLTFVDRWVPFTPAALPLYLSLWVYVSLAPALAVKPAQLRSYGVDVRTVVPTKVHASDANVRYLQAKVSHTAHTIDLPLAV
jgi:hypothetical protein